MANLFLLKAMLPWRYPCDVAEQAREIVAVGNANLVAYLIDVHVGISQHLATRLYFHAVEISERAVAGLTFEEGGEVAGRVARVSGKVLQSQMLLYVFLHIMHSRRHYAVVVSLFLRLTIRADVSHGCQIVVEQRGNIAQTVLAVAVVESVEYLLKDLVAVVYS